MIYVDFPVQAIIKITTDDPWKSVVTKKNNRRGKF